MTRDDFFIAVPTLEEGTTVNLSSSDSLQGEEGCALIQVVENEASIVCSYLNDFQLGVLRDSITEYLSLKGE